MTCKLQTATVSVTQQSTQKAGKAGKKRFAEI